MKLDVSKVTLTLTWKECERLSQRSFWRQVVSKKSRNAGWENCWKGHCDKGPTCSELQRPPHLVSGDLAQRSRCKTRSQPQGSQSKSGAGLHSMESEPSELERTSEVFIEDLSGVLEGGASPWTNVQLLSADCPISGFLLFLLSPLLSLPALWLCPWHVISASTRRWTGLEREDKNWLMKNIVTTKINQNTG